MCKSFPQNPVALIGGDVVDSITLTRNKARNPQPWLSTDRYNTLMPSATGPAGDDWDENYIRASREAEQWVRVFLKIQTPQSSGLLAVGSARCADLRKPRNLRRKRFNHLPAPNTTSYRGGWSKYSVCIFATPIAWSGNVLHDQCCKCSSKNPVLTPKKTSRDVARRPTPISLFVKAVPLVV